MLGQPAQLGCSRPVNTANPKARKPVLANTHLAAPFCYAVTNPGCPGTHAVVSGYFLHAVGPYSAHCCRRSRPSNQLGSFAWQPGPPAVYFTSVCVACATGEGGRGSTSAGPTKQRCTSCCWCATARLESPCLLLGLLQCCILMYTVATSSMLHTKGQGPPISNSLSEASNAPHGGGISITLHTAVVTTSRPSLEGHQGNKHVCPLQP